MWRDVFCAHEGCWDSSDIWHVATLNSMIQYNISSLCHDTCELACINKSDYTKWKLDAKFTFTAPTFKTKSEYGLILALWWTMMGWYPTKRRLLVRYVEPLLPTLVTRRIWLTIFIICAQINMKSIWMKISRKTNNSDTSKQASEVASEPKQILLFHQTVTGILLCFTLQWFFYFKPCNHWILWMSQPFMVCYKLLSLNFSYRIVHSSLTKFCLRLTVKLEQQLRDS